MTIWILALGIAYLLGSIPTGYLLVKTFRNEDIRASGSGNIGATNVARSGAKGLGILTLLFDALKGFVAVIIARHLAQAHSYPDGYRIVAAAGLVAVIGHIFPIWLGFRGGKGVATALGVFLALSPLSALVGLLVFAIVFLYKKYVSLASIVGAICLCAFAVLSSNKQSVFVDLCYIAITLLVVLKHSSNIQRLIAGTEKPFGTKKAA